MLLRNPDANSLACKQAFGLVGQVVRSLCQISASGSVVMRFERCAYIQFNKHLVCIGLREIGASSISALFNHTVQELPQSLVIGASAQLSTECLMVDDSYSFDLRDAALYISAMQDDVLHCRTPITHYGLLEKLNIPSSGLAPLLRHFTVPHVVGSVIAFESISTESDLLGFTIPSITQLAKQIGNNCASSSGVRIERSVFDPNLFKKLLGAGPGLTPSGDDFLCGVLVALRLFGFTEVAESLWASIQAVVMQSTTPVSAVMLEQSVLGESGERLDSVVEAYYEYPGTSADEFQRLVNLIGETSGWDWLTGFVFCGHFVRYKQ